MTFTVLFDLDDTLLKNEMGVFLPSYFSLIQNSLADLLPPERMLPFFLSATQRMMEEQRMDRPLLDVFFDHFLSDTGLSLDEIHEPLDAFYADVYPTLRSATAPVPGAQDVVRTFAERGYRLAVATNPLFPETAVRQRVAWAELPVPLARFELVTANETFHFSKPNPAYYAEVLGYLGWPEMPVVIGNDPLNDVEAAARLGLSTYHVVEDSADGRPPAGNRHGRGPIQGAVEWLDGLSPEDVQPDYRSPDGVLAVYRATAAVFDTALRRAGTAVWDRSEDGGWSPHQVLHHLMEVEEKVNLPRVRSLINEPNPFISGVDTDAWYADGFPPLSDLHETCSRFLEARRQTVRLLSSLDEDGWKLPARHTIFGPTDLLEITHIMARHDQLHVRQVHSLFRTVAPTA